jgi:RimJ/RimL family protein N-acetyltransferase
LRRGDATALDEYDQHGRIRGGPPEQAMDQAAKAYVASYLAGRDVLLRAADWARCRELSHRIRDDLIHLGLVDHGQTVRIAEGAQASAGDLIICRRNDHSIEAGEPGRSLANGDILRIEAIDIPENRILRTACERMLAVPQVDAEPHRRFSVADADNLVSLDADPDVIRFVPGGIPTSREEIDEYPPAFLGYYRRYEGYGFWAVIEKATGDFLGWFHFRPGKDAAPDEIELGYRLRKSAWGRGYATAGSRALIRKGFTKVGVQRVVAEAMAVNPASPPAVRRRKIAAAGPVALVEVPGFPAVLSSINQILTVTAASSNDSHRAMSTVTGMRYGRTDYLPAAANTGSGMYRVLLAARAARQRPPRWRVAGRAASSRAAGERHQLIPRRMPRRCRREGCGPIRARHDEGPSADRRRGS